MWSTWATTRSRVGAPRKSGKKLIPTTPPRAARARNWSSVRLRRWGWTAAASEWVATIGPLVAARTSQNAAAERCETSTIIPRSCIRATTLRPSGDSPPWRVSRAPSASRLAGFQVRLASRTPSRYSRSTCSISPWRASPRFSKYRGDLSGAARSGDLLDGARGGDRAGVPAHRPVKRRDQLAGARLPSRRLPRVDVGGEDLNIHAPLPQARDVHLAAAAAVQRALARRQVEQRVHVQVDDHRVTVDLQGISHGRGAQG